MIILASLVKGLNIHLVDISIRVGIGLKKSISIIFIVGAGGLITDLLTVWRRFILNSINIIRANIFINYTIGIAD